MRLKVLGAYGASDAEHNLTGYLIDDWLAVDAGTLTSKLSFAQQARIQAVFITHPHADHIRDLPHLIHNRFSQNAGAADDLRRERRDGAAGRQRLQRHRLARFREADLAADEGKPAVITVPMTPGKKVMFNDVGLTAGAGRSPDPRRGRDRGDERPGHLFTGDTGPTTEIWKRTNKTPNVVAVVTEASFPNDQQSLADETAHLSPQHVRRRAEEDHRRRAGLRQPPQDPVRARHRVADPESAGSTGAGAAGEELHVVAAVIRAASTDKSV